MNCMNKRIFFFFFTILTLAGCGNENTNTATKDHIDSANTGKTVQTPVNDEPVNINKAIKKEDYESGMLLVKNSDCKGCHKNQEKVIGPSYQDVANKYPVKKITIDTLAEKIIKGGVGVWGQIPMQPHNNLSKEDARKMVKYIFARKNN